MAKNPKPTKVKLTTIEEGKLRVELNLGPTRYRQIFWVPDEQSHWEEGTYRWDPRKKAWIDEDPNLEGNHPATVAAWAFLPDTYAGWPPVGEPRGPRKARAAAGSRAASARKRKPKRKKLTDAERAAATRKLVNELARG